MPGDSGVCQALQPFHELHVLVLENPLSDSEGLSYVAHAKRELVRAGP